MAKPGLFISDVKINFRLRDFFLDFMACIVPGLIFLIAVTIIVSGTMTIIIFDEEIGIVIKNLLESHALIEGSSESHPGEKSQTNANFYDLASSVFKTFSFNFWFITLLTVLSYFSGHLLYRQTPKVPDFASFLRIRKKVIKVRKNGGTNNEVKDDEEKGDAVKGDAEKDDEEKGDWVIARDKGLKAREVQFPYSNLKMYLKSRGFLHLMEFVNWTPETGHRSKTIINKAKIRIAFFLPEHTIQIIRNEAHIRLASSMWYASKYILLTSYITLFIFILFLLINSFPVDVKEGVFFLIIFSLLLVGYIFREIASKVMGKFSSNGKTDLEISRIASWVDKLWRLHDMSPLICNIILMLGIAFIFNSNDFILKELILVFLSIQAFILVGSLFAKLRIEETFHYQRVREIVYVLETAYLSKVLEEDLPDPLRTESLPYEIKLTGANVALNLRENKIKSQGV